MSIPYFICTLLTEYVTMTSMTATGHAVIGTVIAAKISNPYIAVALALSSHVLADLFPHWDSGTNGKKKSRTRKITEAAADVVVSYIVSYLLMFYLFPTTDITYGFMMVFAAQFFDWVTAPYYFLGLHMQPFKWFYKFQSATNSRLDKPWGIINQIGILLLLIILAKIL